MERFSAILICLSISAGVSAFDNAAPLENPDHSRIPERPQDTMILNQILYNGKVWIGLYYGVYGTEFFIDNDWKTGDLTINGRVFTGIQLKYDTYNDNLLTNFLGKHVIILNREMVDSFNIYRETGVIRFTNMTGINGMVGYYEMLYDGGTQLYKKWKKRRAQFAVEARYDEFQPDNRLWLVKDNELFQLSGRRMLLKLLAGRDDNLKRELRKSNIKIDLNSPESIKSLLKVFDMIQSE